MIHKICFRDTETGWHNALPLGNGKFGAMVYYRRRCLRIAMNQYDCYYHVLAQYAKKPGNGQMAGFDDPARREKTFEELKELVDEARKTSDYSRAHYLRILNPDADKSRPIYQGGSYPQAGEIVLEFSDLVDVDASLLVLEIENGKVRFTAGSGEAKVKAEIFVASDMDGVVIKLSQSESGLWEQPYLWLQDGRGQEKYHYEKYAYEDGCTLRCLFHPDSEWPEVPLFQQETAVYFPGKEGDWRERSVTASVQAEKADGGKEGTTTACEQAERQGDWKEVAATACVQAEREDTWKEVTATACVQAEKEGSWRERTVTASVQPGKGGAEAVARSLWMDRERAAAHHEEKWRNFWKSSVRLPDSYLETLWHLSVYLLECCSGRGSVHSEQACGLSGLWDIRRPCMWGSMWYWDVNIQTAFYGTFASNHTELSRVFCDAFLSYRDEAIRFGERIYGIKGWALDYPHPLYHCIQPWCALFLWKYYAYTGDREFLEKKAYPVFGEILDFYEKIGERDRDGILHLRYDICPEQGPVGEDCVITMAALRQLAKYAAAGAGILGKPKEEQGRWEELLASIPEYPVTRDKKRWKDSPSVEDDIFLRHPSVLMPIFPTDEVHMESTPKEKKLAEETLRYVQNHTERGTFGFVWTAAAAARMGMGSDALRILYEQGLDYVTHSNGLCYEESERFINYCHITKPANYLPAMCETSGGITEAVNLMLLQEINGCIHIFPALPDGRCHLENIKTQYREDDRYLADSCPAWKDCGFRGLLTPGGFEISAERHQGKTIWIQVHSISGGMLRLFLPQELAGKETLYEKEMKAGETLHFGRQIQNSGTKSREEILVRRAAVTHRRIFLGEDKNTEFYKAVDSMVCPYGFAEGLRYPMTPYVFDFTEDTGKNYDAVYERQIIQAGRAVLHATAPRPIGKEGYTGNRGYGFTSGEVEIVRRQGSDQLRCDFAQGSKKAEFGVELPAGKYELLVISGDEREDSLTHLSVEESGIRLLGAPKKAGRYQCRRIPLIHREDGILRLGLDTEPGYRWKLNAVFINKDYSLL